MLMQDKKRTSSLAELVLAHTTERAHPVGGQVVESCSGSDSVLRIAYFGVILITTNVANVLLHNDGCFFIIINE
jgi:hypothetical protein